MVFLEFEKPIADLYDQLNKLKAMDSEGTVDLDATVAALEKRIETEREDLYKNLTSWQRVQLSRHPERPYTLDYVKGSLLTSLSFMVTEMYTMIKPL